ncbi:hypothetical protein [Roseateles flavus]|uniref:Uncharacterized protein n=1 Tax=Roseateles flavus TaxID=3149041 RepID=A0ABV0GGD8_9BURK
MSKPTLNQAFLDQLRLSAKDKARQDPSLSYMQWLDELCSELGFTYNSLRDRIKELEAQALAESLAAEDTMWVQRLALPRVWGSLPPATRQKFPLPLEGDRDVPWPNSLVTCSLFTVTEIGPRQAKSGPVFSLDDESMAYQGDELRVSCDQTLLMAFIMASRGMRCGALVSCSLESLEARMGCRLTELGMPIEVREIERTLWRLCHCRLEFAARRFDGPILAYVNATKAPAQFEYAFNPDFANFYFPILAILGSLFGEDDASS